MINYIIVFFLPGSAGNFFSRALSLISDDHYCLIPKTSESVNWSVADKFNFCNYNNHQPGTNWITFENQLVHYATLFNHHKLPNNSYSIWYRHPDYSILQNNIVGINDNQFVFYIDPTDKFEWCILNAFYKNSYINAEWLQTGRQMLEDPSIYKIKLSNIISSKETFLLEIKNVSDLIGSTLNIDNIRLLETMWDQWIATTLKESEFEKFKEQIGFKL